MHCEVCKARYFVGYPQASEAAQAACDAMIQQLRPGSLLIAHPSKQTSSGGAWARTVILLLERRRKDEVDKSSTSYRLLDQQGGDCCLIGVVLTGGEWNPPTIAPPRHPAYASSVKELRLPGGPVKSEKCVLHNLTNLGNMRVGTPVVLLESRRRLLRRHSSRSHCCCAVRTRVPPPSPRMPTGFMARLSSSRARAPPCGPTLN